MFCTNCGSQLPDGSKFCSNCGAKFSPAESAQQAQPPHQQPYQQPYQQGYQNPYGSPTGIVADHSINGLSS